MKKYSTQKAHRGKTAYRTPSVFRYKNIKKVESFEIRKKRCLYKKNGK